MRAREIVIPLVVGLVVAFIQAIFSGPDLIRIIVYFIAGLAVAGIGVLVYRYLSGRQSGPTLNDVVRAARMEADRREQLPRESRHGGKDRVMADVKPEDLLAIDDMDNLTRNERNRLLEPYIGQWFTVEGIVDDVQGTADDVTVSVYITERDHRVTANFKDHKIRASSLRKGIPIRVIGSFEHVQGYMGSISLTDCEFLPLDPSIRPERRINESSAPDGKAAAPIDRSPEVVAPFSAPLAEPGQSFSGVGVGKTDTFRVAKPFGFKWTPNGGVVIGSLHGTLNGIPHSWTFDNNANPYFPGRYSTPPDVPGNYFFTIDNIKPEAPWTITVLNEEEQPGSAVQEPKKESATSTAQPGQSTYETWSGSGRVAPWDYSVDGQPPGPWQAYTGPTYHSFGGTFIVSTHVVCPAHIGVEVIVGGKTYTATEEDRVAIPAGNYSPVVRLRNDGGGGGTCTWTIKIRG